MKNQSSQNPSRRQFITKIIPGCALTCLGTGNLLSAISKPAQEASRGSTHKFDSELNKNLTYRQLFQRQYFNTIEFGKLLKQELGDEKAIELIKKLCNKSSIERGKELAQQLGENSLQVFVRQFKDPNTYKIVLTKEVVEDTVNAFELKVTECLWATVFRERDAADIGFAWICYGDYGLPQGFNPKIRMLRDKTLMQGHPCCNHRYVWTG
jgi:hypothetical protein